MVRTYGVSDFVMPVDRLPGRCVGVSAYRGVIVCFDEDYDTRVVELLDGMTDRERAELVAVFENEGCVNLYWRCEVPERFRVAMIGIANDYWTAFHYVGNDAELSYEGEMRLSQPAPKQEGKPAVALMFVVAA